MTSTTVFLALYVVLIGLIIGSFLNVVIFRVPRKQSPARGGSGCPECGHPIRWYDNIPLVSYVVLRGRCRDCGKPISPRYPSVELITGLLFLFVYLKELAGNEEFFLEYAGILTFAAFSYFAAMLVAVSFIDAEWHKIPDRITVPSFFIGAALLLAADPSSWPNTLAGAAIGGGSLLVIYLLAPLVFKKQGMGLGDVKLGVVMGVFLGWHVVLALFLASLAGTLFGAGMMAARKLKWRDRFAFGPCLAVGGLLTYFFGDPIINWYLNLFL